MPSETSSDIAAAILMERLVRDSYPQRASKEIQPLQWSILRYLERPRSDMVNVSSVAQFLGLTIAPVSRALNTLVRRGLVETVPNPDDGRSLLLKLSPAGTQMLVQDPMRAFANRLAALPEPEREQFKRCLQKLTLNG